MRDPYFFIFKRFIPLMITIIGLILTYLLYTNIIIIENVAYNSVAIIGSILLSFFGVFLYSKEISLREIYKLFYLLFFGMSIFLIVRFFYYIPGYESAIDVLINFSFYGVSFLFVMLFKMASEKNKATTL